MPEFLFKTRTIKIATLSEYLCQVRNKLNLDIKTVSLLTQIKESYIENLEAGNYTNLPADVYIKGFLKSLGTVYGIKEEVLIQQYEKEQGLEPKLDSQSPVSWFSKVHLTPKTMILSATVLITLMTLGYVGLQIRSVLAPPLLALNTPADNMNVKGESLVVSGWAEVGSEVTINNQAILTDKNGSFNENLVLSPGINVIEVSAKNKFGKVSKITRKVNAEVIMNQALAVTVAISVTVEVGPASAWIYLEADGIVVQRGTMLSGSSKTISANNEVLLTTANAGSTRVIYNGKDLGRLGREGEVVRNIEFNASQ